MLDIHNDVYTKFTYSQNSSNSFEFRGNTLVGSLKKNNHRTILSITVRLHVFRWWSASDFESLLSSTIWEIFWVSTFNYYAIYIICEWCQIKMIVQFRLDQIKYSKIKVAKKVITNLRHFSNITQINTTVQHQNHSNEMCFTKLLGFIMTVDWWGSSIYIYIHLRWSKWV